MRSLVIGILLLFSFSALTYAQNQEMGWAGEVVIPVPTQSERIPSWSGGRLVVIRNNLTASPSFYQINESGLQESKVIQFSIPGASKIIVDDWARSRDGALVICGGAVAPDGRAGGFFAVISPSGKDSHITRTAPYAPKRIVIPSDGTIWTVGTEIENGYEPSDHSYGVLRHFSQDGNLLGSFLPRSTFASRLSIESGIMAVNATKIAWYAGMMTANPENTEYIEISLADGLIQRLPTASAGLTGKVNGMAITNDDQVFVTTNATTSPVGQHILKKILRWDRTSSRWSETQTLEDSRWGYLLGGDGNRLVLNSGDASKGHTFRFLRVMSK